MLVFSVVVHMTWRERNGRIFYRKEKGHGEPSVMAKTQIRLYVAQYLINVCRQGTLPMQQLASTRRMLLNTANLKNLWLILTMISNTE